MNKYKLNMKTPSGLGTEYIYVESKYDNFERYLKEHNLKYQKYNFKTSQDKEIERLNKELEFEKLKNKEVREYTESHFKQMVADEEAQKLLEILDKENI